MKSIRCTVLHTLSGKTARERLVGRLRSRGGHRGFKVLMAVCQSSNCGSKLRHSVLKAVKFACHLFVINSSGWFDGKGQSGDISLTNSPKPSQRQSLTFEIPGGD